MGARRPNPRRTDRSRRNARRHTRRHGLATRVARPQPAGNAHIWGRHAVREALRRHGLVDHVFIVRADAGELTGIRDAAAASAVPITFSDTSELDTMSFGSPHQGVAATVQHVPPASLDDLAQASSAGGAPLILATDQIQDVGNLGALLRTLEAVDGAGIVVPSRRSASMTGGLARASAGASLRTRIVEVTNVSRALNELREAGVWLYALDQNGNTDHDAVDFNRPTCLVVGNESHGIRPMVRKTCDEVIRIRMYGGIGSLNVSVAGAIVMHHAIWSRGGSTLNDT